MVVINVGFLMITFLKALKATIEDAAKNSRRYYILRVAFLLLRYVQQETMSHSM
jgi:hypothetical protein